MPIITADVLYLGNFSDMDTNEDKDGNVEDTSPIDGVTYGSAANPLFSDSLVTASFNDSNNDGNLDSDHSTHHGSSSGVGESVSYDLGSGTTSSVIDTVATVSGTINYKDGSSVTINEAYVYQLQNGDLFIYNSNWSGSTDLNQNTGVGIESLDLDYKNVEWYDIYAGEIESIVCFAAGTLIETIKGECEIEALSAGDQVLTRDAGYQSISWIGRRHLNRSDLAKNQKLRPIRIKAGALGPNLPTKDLLVSPQHRVLVASPIAVRMFDTAEVLIPANKLLALEGIDIDLGVREVEYFHILLDSHHLVWSNGAQTETLCTGPEALKSVSSEAREEITSLFPEILDPDYIASSARPIPEKGKRMKRLAQRLVQNNKAAQHLEMQL